MGGRNILNWRLRGGGRKRLNILLHFWSGGKSQRKEFLLGREENLNRQANYKGIKNIGKKPGGQRFRKEVGVVWFGSGQGRDI